MRLGNIDINDWKRGNTDLQRIMSGTRLVWERVPSLITNFKASDFSIGQIIMTWSAATNATSYDVYEGTTLRATNVSSGWAWDSLGSKTGTFHVRAINSAGFTNSNTNQGQSWTGLSAELMPNNSFGDTSQWSTGSGWSISSGRLHFNSATAAQNANQGLSPTNGWTYRIGINCISNTGVQTTTPHEFAGIRFMGGVLQVGATEYHMTAGSNTTKFYISARDNQRFSVEWYTVKRLLP